MLMPRVITSMSAQIYPGREDELPDGSSGQQPTALSARCRCPGRVVPGASRRPRVTSSGHLVQAGSAELGIEVGDGAGRLGACVVGAGKRVDRQVGRVDVALDHVDRRIASYSLAVYRC